METTEREWRPPAPNAPARRIRSRLRPSPRLLAELRSDQPWGYPWSLGPGARARVVDKAEAEAQDTFAETIERPVREGLAMAGGGSALDLGGGEGWIAHQLLDWGAERVLGVERDPTAARRADLIANEIQAPMRRLEFREVAFEDWRAARLGRHDVVLLRGGIGEVEDPIGLLRRAARMASLLLVLDTPLRTDDLRSPFDELDPERPGTLELRATGSNGSAATRLAPVPDRAGAIAMLSAAGFWRVEEARLPVPAAARYASGERGIFFAYTAPAHAPGDAGDGGDGDG